MANILLFVYPSAGPINATRALVQELRQRGHRVLYAGIAACEQYLKGEEFLPIFSRSIPESVTPPKKLFGSASFESIRRQRLLASRIKLLLSGVRCGTFDGFDRAIEKAQPDLIVIESTTWYAIAWALLAHRFKVPYVYLNDTLTGPENCFVPPVTSMSQPSLSLYGLAKTQFEWKFLSVIWRWINLYQRLLCGMNADLFARDLAAACNFPESELVRHEKVFIRTKAPEIMLIPEAFDFPHLRMPQRYYGSASVDVARQECCFPWERLLPPKPIVYCALGTIDIVPQEQYRRFFEAVINAFSVFSGKYHLVIATGEHFEPDRLHVQGSDVTLVKRAPQVAVLKSAALMISHGGSNSVRECITMGVPMLLYPITFDAFGFSARAVFHGLGLAGDFRHFSATGIRKRMGQLLESPNFRFQARRMQSEFVRAQKSGSAADLVETFANDCALIRHEQLGPVDQFPDGLRL